MKKALFIDRDGTIIAEPADEQIDSLEKLAFVPGAISALKALTGLGFDLVLATNQDGLGTPSFPEDTFWPAHNKMLATLGGEGVAFDDQLIDRTFEADAAPTRKPRTGMFGRYTGGEYDLAASYVIGDRATDILLARNLGARGILLAPPAEGLRTLEESGAADACALVTDSWSEIAEFIRRGERRTEIRRETRETQITVRLDLDGRGISTAKSPRACAFWTTCSRRSPTTAASRWPSTRGAIWTSTNTTRWRTWPSRWARPSTARWARRPGSPATASPCRWTTAGH